MKFIDESIIDQAIEELEKDAESYMQQLRTEQGSLLAYLFSEDFQMLTPDEREYLLYCALVIWRAITLGHDEVAPLGEHEIGSAEEKNWEQMNSKGRFRDRISPFFENYPQEDLLAFVEDALVHDEEDPFISNEGRDYLFITLKSIIDAFGKVIKA
ncbi:MAG: hypothetical protein AAFP19_03340 [Bacteroidota bacterium]